MTLLTRAPDLLQAKHTSVIADIRIWVDAPDAKPAEHLREILVAHGCNGKRLGVEWEAYGLTARNGQRLAAALARRFDLPPGESADLTRAAQYVALTKGSGPLYEELQTLLAAETQVTNLHRFFAGLPPLC